MYLSTLALAMFYVLFDLFLVKVTRTFYIVHYAVCTGEGTNLTNRYVGWQQVQRVSKGFRKGFTRSIFSGQTENWVLSSPHPPER